MNIVFEKYIRDTLEAKRLKEAYNYVFSLFYEKGKDLINNQYVSSADIETIREWEKFLTITEDNMLTLEERRSQVLLKLLAKPPYTLNTIKEQLTSIMGGEIEVEMDNTDLILTVTYEDATAFQINLMTQYLSQVKPANVVFKAITKANDLDSIKPLYVVSSDIEYVEV